MISAVQTYGVITPCRDQMYVSNHILYVNDGINWQQAMGNSEACFSPARAARCSHTNSRSLHTSASLFLHGIYNIASLCHSIHLHILRKSHLASTFKSQNKYRGMNRIFISTCCVLFLISATYGQNVGIGTSQPNASAALDIQSNNKGLLIPRVDVAAVVAPANGLMVFNSNPSAINGTGLYINMGTSIAPQWVRVASSESGNFIRNQQTLQPNSGFNISGDGIIGDHLIVGNNSGVSYRMEIKSSSSLFTGMLMRNTSSNSTWALRVNGTANIPGAFVLYNSNSNNTPIIAVDGKVGINKSDAPTEALDVNGNIKASGVFLVDLKTTRYEFSISGNSHGIATVPCPPGYRLITGGGGHRDYNSALNDIELAYNGPDPDAPTTKWRILVQNTSSRSRAMVVFCNCAKVR